MLILKVLVLMLQMSARSIFAVFLIKKIKSVARVKKGWQTCAAIVLILLVNKLLLRQTPFH